MTRISTILMFFLLFSLIAGSVFLATWEIPAPTAPVEKVIPDDQFSS